MAKAKQRGAADSGKKKTRIGQIILAVVVVGAVIAAFVLRNQGSSSGGDSTAGNDNTADMLKDTAPIRNRLVLPAKPQSVRPITLSPSDFPEPEVKAAYQAAKDAPDALEHVACYCGCFSSSGHRNNLDCFKDQHGAT
jgi:uncharacterized protein with PCYCGC motif